MGIEMVRLTPTTILSMKLSDDVRGQAEGSVHGGILATFADVTAAVAFWNAFDADSEMPVTTDLHLRYPTTAQWSTHGRRDSRPPGPSASQYGMRRLRRRGTSPCSINGHVYGRAACKLTPCRTHRPAVSTSDRLGAPDRRLRVALSSFRHRGARGPTTAHDRHLGDRPARPLSCSSATGGPDAGNTAIR